VPALDGRPGGNLGAEMTEKTATQTFPRRDADGRVVDVGQFLGATVAATLLGFVLVAVVDGLLALLRISAWGSASGWLAAILPALLCFDDLRGWRAYPVRYLVGLVGLGVALGLGLGAAGLVTARPILSGAVGAITAAVVYTLVWFFGIRWLTGQYGDKGSG
jgi:hypothetical protein